MDGYEQVDDFTNLNSSYMQRPRIDMLLDRATQCKLVYVIAGAGYGKTRAVSHYVEQQEAVVRWVQLTESDNIGSRYWENLTRNVSLDNPELAEKMLELGFPDTLARFKQFASLLKSAEHRTHKTYLVLDDFHLINSKQALTFAERCAYLKVPGACVIIISRKEPGINTVPLLSKGAVSIITEDELRLTDDEIADFLAQRDISVSQQNLPRLFDATKGWAIAVQLLSLVLKRLPDNIDSAVDVMKQNVFKLLEMEAFNDFPENIKKNMVMLALVSDLPFRTLLDVIEDGPFIENYPQLTSFVWYDSFSGGYRIHPLYLEFLQSRHYILTDDEKSDAYRRAAQWCLDNHMYMDAMKYFAALRQFDAMLGILLSYPFKLPPDTCGYFFDIIENITPDNEEQNNLSFLLLKNFFIPILLVGMNKYDEARQRSLDIIQEFEHTDTPFALTMLSAAYSNLAYIDMYTCTVTHRYDSADYLKKSVEYFKLLSAPPAKVTGAFAVPDIRSFICLVGEGAELSEFDKHLEAAQQTAIYVAQTAHDMYYGYDDLLACEIEYYKNRPETARTHARQAIIKAREKKQYSIEAMAQYYLLMISMRQGEADIVSELLKQLSDHLDNPSFWNRQIIYDLIIGSFYAQLGLPDMVPPWLVDNEQEETSKVHVPARELIVSVQSYIALKRYNQALTVLCNSYPREPQERFAFGELILTLLTAAAKIKTGDTQGAAEDFESAYRASHGGVFEMPFVELGGELQPLVSAMLKKEGSKIPKEWLHVISRKASAYVKNADVVKRSCLSLKKSSNPVSLSAREKEVLIDLSNGLSRDEIAAIRYLSVNTVKKILQSIYIKLDAVNNVEAVRIAIEKKLI